MKKYNKTFQVIQNFKLNSVRFIIVDFFKHLLCKKTHNSVYYNLSNYF